MSIKSFRKLVKYRTTRSLKAADKTLVKKTALLHISVQLYGVLVS